MAGELIWQPKVSHSPEFNLIYCGMHLALIIITGNNSSSLIKQWEWYSEKKFTILFVALQTRLMRVKGLKRWEACIFQIQGQIYMANLMLNHN